MEEILKNFTQFAACSANDNNNKHLWLVGASLFIRQINGLVDLIGHKLDITNIEDFENSSSHELGKILANNRSDKSNYHNYHIMYSYIFNQLGKNNELNILEIGLGTNNPNLVSTMGLDGRPGASLYSFAEYLPNSDIYGADIDKDILFETDRIKTTYLDQLNYSTFKELSAKFGNIKYDLIIDDGLHSIGANFNTLLFALEYIKKNGWIVIEDIALIENWKAIDYILKSTNQFKIYILRTKLAFMYIVNKL